MTTWGEIRDEIAGMLADGKPLEDVIDKLEKRKNEMTKANLLKAMDDMKKPHELTNEEWFCGLSTEEKAIWIERRMFIVRYRKEVEDGAYMQTITKKDYIENWLREKHHGNNDM